MNAGLNRISGCEVCGNDDLTRVLDLGDHPLCDDLIPVGDDRVCAEYPISILFCPACRTAHQEFQVPKRELFPETYHYRSRFTADVLEGMKSLVEKCEESFGALAGSKVLDVGCNDGSLLGFFRDRGAVTLGIEPTGACADAAAAGHVTFNEFLDPDVSERLVAEHGHPDLIVFTNVFAHIENLEEVLDSLRILMGPASRLVIENHYLGSVLEGNQFDTFYHEHPRTYSCTSFVHVARRLDREVSDVEFPSRYGGNIRVFLTPPSGGGADRDIPKAIREREERFIGQFSRMRAGIERWKARKGTLIGDLVGDHGPLAGKAFPGRAAILVKLLGLGNDEISVVHEKPGSMKIGHYVPGTRIPIVSDDELFATGDLSAPLLNLAWHISGEIREYLERLGYRGPIIDIVGEGDFA